MKSLKKPPSSVPSVASMATGPLRNVLNITPKPITSTHLQPDAQVALDEVQRERGVAGAEVHVGLAGPEVLRRLHALQPDLHLAVVDDVLEQVDLLVRRAFADSRGMICSSMTNSFDSKIRTSTFLPVFGFRTLRLPSTPFSMSPL